MDSKQKAIALEYFKKYDTNTNNFIDLSELTSLMSDVAKEAGLPAPEESEIVDLLKDYDVNKDKKISQQEFLQLFEVILDIKK